MENLKLEEKETELVLHALKALEFQRRAGDNIFKSLANPSPSLWKVRKAEAEILFEDLAILTGKLLAHKREVKHHELLQETFNIITNQSPNHMEKVKIRKFFKQTVSQIQGPTEPINFLGSSEEITQEQAQEFLDNYLADKKGPEVDQLKGKAWTYILNGESVTMGKVCISSKIFSAAKNRIAART